MKQNNKSSRASWVKMGKMKMKSIGGNSGYVGYSQSVRSMNAKQEGRFPKTLFKKYYEISEKKFNELLDRGVIYVSEWHHTSKFGNKTKFYDIDNKILFYLLIGRRETAYRLYKQSKPTGVNIASNPKSRINRENFLSAATEEFLGKVEIGDVVFFKGVAIECCGKTKYRKAPYFAFAK